MPLPDIKVYRYLGVFKNCVFCDCTWIFTQRGQRCGMCVSALIKSAHVPVQHPSHISNACSAPLCCRNMKYAWTIKSIWTIHLNIRYSKPSERSLNLTHTHSLMHTHVHTKWHINMHSHVVHNGLSVSVPTLCWQCKCSKTQRRAHERALTHSNTGGEEKMWHWF